MMRTISLAMVIVTLLLGGCVTPQDTSAIEFRAAVHRVATSLEQQVKLRTLNPLGQLAGGTNGQPARDPNGFVIDPFVDGDSGSLIEASTQIQQVLTEDLTLAGHHVQPLSYATLQGARYVITGATTYEVDPTYGRKLYRISGSVIDIPTGDVVANAWTWVSDPRIPDDLTPFYRNSPMFVEDTAVRAKLRAATSRVSPGGASDYATMLPALSYAAEGRDAVERGDYAAAFRATDLSLQQPGGKEIMDVYVARYEASYQGGHPDAAAEAFYSMFGLGMANRKNTLKFLFVVNSTDFAGGAKLRDEYGLWLRTIERYLNESGNCLSITGHASKTGDDTFNMTLSKQRAERVKTLIGGRHRDILQRMSTDGQGYRQCIRCSGTDDMLDAVDRRVVFEPRQCAVASLFPPGTRLADARD